MAKKSKSYMRDKTAAILDSGSDYTVENSNYDQNTNRSENLLIYENKLKEKNEERFKSIQTVANSDIEQNLQKLEQKKLVLEKNFKKTDIRGSLMCYGPTAVLSLLFFMYIFQISIPTIIFGIIMGISIVTILLFFILPDGVKKFKKEIGTLEAEIEYFKARKGKNKEEEKEIVTENQALTSIKESVNKIKELSDEKKIAAYENIIADLKRLKLKHKEDIRIQFITKIQTMMKTHLANKRKEAMKKLNGLFKISKTIEIKDILQILGITRPQFMNMVMDNPNMLGNFQINGDMLALKENANMDEGINSFLSGLDNQFGDWEDKEFSKDGKIESSPSDFDFGDISGQTPQYVTPQPRPSYTPQPTPVAKPVQYSTCPQCSAQIVVYAPKCTSCGLEIQWQ
jgi:hypothetical protein